MRMRHRASVAGDSPAIPLPRGGPVPQPEWSPPMGRRRRRLVAILATTATVAALLPPAWPPRPPPAARRPPSAGPGRSPRDTSPPTSTTAPVRRHPTPASAAWPAPSTPTCGGTDSAPRRRSAPAARRSPPGCPPTRRPPPARTSPPTSDLFGLDAAAVAAWNGAGPADRQRARGHPAAALRRPARRAGRPGHPRGRRRQRALGQLLAGPRHRARRRRPPLTAEQAYAAALADAGLDRRRGRQPHQSGRWPCPRRWTGRGPPTR